MGKSKQLLPYLGRTLVEHAALTALASGAAEVVVVIGAEADAVRSALGSLAAKIVFNEVWAKGMGGSIRVGVQALGPVDSAVICLADQPKITADHIRSLAQRQLETGCEVVASSYDGVLGAPCAFSRALFPKLLSLAGDAGARSLIRESSEVVEVVEFTGGSFDIDTPEDYGSKD